MKRVSMEDIAQKVGVSRNTVSLVFREMPGISEQTRRQVLETAQQMGYVFTGSAKKGKAHTSPKNICLIIPETTRNSYGFFSNVQYGIEREAKRYGYNTIIDYYDERAGYQTPGCIRDRLVCGAITLGRISKTTAQRILSDGLPLVMADHYFNTLRTHCVLTDNTQGAYMAVSHLVQMGHRRIGFVGDVSLSPSFKDRYEGYVKALEAHSLHSPKCPVLHKSLETLEEQDPMLAVETLQTLGSMPEAFFCCNDAEAIATLKALTRMQIRVPENVSIMGFDDIDSARDMIPGLTTVRVEKEWMGAQAVAQLIKKIKHPEQPEQKLLLYTSLIERQSVKNRNAAAESR